MRLIDADKLDVYEMRFRSALELQDYLSTQETISEKSAIWIPCSERLPEDDTEVFVYLFNSQSPYIAWVTDSCWFTEDFQVEKENYPKAWMPLPKPYKEENHE